MAVEVLGEVLAPSGTVLVIDAGLLDLWCHDRPPVLPDGLMPPEATAAANDAVDYRAEGADAATACQRFDRSMYDIPRAGCQRHEALFAAAAAGLDARLIAQERRVPHLERARAALRGGQGGGGEFTMHGVRVVAVQTAGGAGPLRVIGERCGVEPYARCWKWVALEVAPGEAVASVCAGTVAVDKARLMFVDLDAVGSWEHHQPTDGLADFVFWGRDAAAAAARFGAPELRDEAGVFGFLDLTLKQVVQVGGEIEAAVDAGKYRMRTDFRPHSHHYHILKQMRSTATESGSIELAGSRTCAFFTTWGDGFFPVFRDFDASGALLRVRIELGTAAAVENMARVNGL
eukprot:c35966_g1_i1.p1 GENE.c35966_g1_i1~~c35966_g1_i1.p1  ORF type:complete len:368 (+),score=63.72 c35966_g1_i1:69-1106(+)